MPKFVPRQRKRKVLDRQRAEAARQHDADTEEAQNNGDGVAAETERLKAQLRDQGQTVSTKKAKRLEKFVENKLKKDETRELLAKLSANKIDTSLFSSTRTLGQSKQTKRQALAQAMREQKAGLATGQEEREELLFQRIDADSASDSEDDGKRVSEAPAAATIHKTAPVSTTPVPNPAADSKPMGSGLKRPLDVDDDGRPRIPKRQKRGGVKSKVFAAKAPVNFVMEDEEEEVEEWGGFSEEDDEEGGEENSDEEEEEDDDEEDDEGDDSDGSDEEEDDDDEDDDDDNSDSGGDGDTRQRSSIFKQWAQAQRNEALGFEPSQSTVLDIPRPANFKPRPLEQDPLPLELQPTEDSDRKAYTIPVTRCQEIQEARMKLPVVGEEQRIMEAVHNNDIVVICGATGSGKTTQVPQFLFEAGYGSADSPTPGMICVTQPRRVAAVSMHKRVALELGDHSDKVGYQIRFEGSFGSKTAIKFVTDGVVLREISDDLLLHRYSAIIVDEAHERSVNTDILIGILSRIVIRRAEMAKKDPQHKPLKLIIMSATLHIEEFIKNKNLFPKPPPVVEVEGRQFPVTMHFARKTHHDYVEEAFKKISRGHRKLPPGGMLVFLTGQPEIVRLRERLELEFNRVRTASGPQVKVSTEELPMEAEDIDFGDSFDPSRDDYDEDSDDEDEDEDEFKVDDQDQESGTGPTKMHVLPLYSLLPTKEQMRVFQPPPENTRLVVLSTNVAETSLTIPGIRYVFDCGRAKERKYDSLTSVQSFEVGWISKASANQRSGRAGRVGPGHCWRMYSSAVYEGFPEFSVPEILRTPLEATVLQLKAMKLRNVVHFPYPTAPEPASIVKAERLLRTIGALMDGNELTKIGQTMEKFPLAPRFSRILLFGRQHDCLQYCITLVAALSSGEIFVPENQVIPKKVEPEPGQIRTNVDVDVETQRDELKKRFNAQHKRFCALDDKSDAMKMLMVLGEFALDPTEQWCERHFVRHKALREAQQLRRQIFELCKRNISSFANITFQDRLDKPSETQIEALKLMVAAGFIDNIAMRADMSPNPPELPFKPRRAIDVSYIPLTPLAGAGADVEERMVYIHPSSPLAHLPTQECPEYVVYAYLQKPAPSPDDTRKKGKTRMHALTDISGWQIGNIARKTPLIRHGKPIKVVKEEGGSREVWVVPYLQAEGAPGLGWPLPQQLVKQKKVDGSWVVE